MLRKSLQSFRSLHFSASRLAPNVLIEPPELQAKIAARKPLTIIDTRPEHEFAAGHIEGAFNIPAFFTRLLKDSSPDSLGKLHYGFAKLLGSRGIRLDDDMVVYEEAMDAAKGASCRAYFLLRYLGCPSVSVLHGGLVGWRKEKLGLNKEPEPPREAVEVKPNPQPGILAKADDVLEALNDGKTGLLDDRDEDEWLGYSSSPYGADFCPRKGRIPGAKWVLWTDLMETLDGVPRLKSPKDVAQICGEAGFTDPAQPIIIYCFKGARASNTFLAMEAAGFSQLRNYLGSWNEWSRDDALPIDDRVLDDPE